MTKRLCEVVAALHRNRTDDRALQDCCRTYMNDDQSGQLFSFLKRAALARLSLKCLLSSYGESEAETGSSGAVTQNQIFDTYRLTKKM
ncbi:hypothetical protein DICVIV_09694 [Dictyocaulus viviparus]|uniref:Uncharacterized protein n=1 Tax=Dictyocaulus viviparus TaxID=29172 RepID=A0A0D8XPI3_DICVI|nr:hypothetical protein DICVIV_09694 [Dictyocaulus viviparus]